MRLSKRQPAEILTCGVTVSNAEDGVAKDFLIQEIVTVDGVVTVVRRGLVRGVKFDVVAVAPVRTVSEYALEPGTRNVPVVESIGYGEVLAEFRLNAVVGVHVDSLVVSKLAVGTGAGFDFLAQDA